MRTTTKKNRSAYPKTLDEKHRTLICATHVNSPNSYKEEYIATITTAAALISLRDTLL
jgi:hypothetical protein